MQHRKLSFIDKLIINVDTVVKTLTTGAAHAERANPANSHAESVSDEAERKHTAGLMRINHCGEVCAQAMYQGQAFTARRDDIRDTMNQSAAEEIDHLVWCEERIHDLGSRTSVLNPAFYGASFMIGAIAGAIGDKLSLGLVAATEDQVCLHLEEHLEQIPESDQRSRAILEQMLVDEKRHSDHAIDLGGMRFSQQVKSGMTMLSKVMTTSTYRL